MSADNSTCYWDVSVTDLYDTTASSNGPFLLQISQKEVVLTNLQQDLTYLSIGLHVSVYKSATQTKNLHQWEESVDPDGNDILIIISSIHLI